MHVLRVRGLKDWAKGRRLSLQAAGRRVRYQWLRRILKRYHYPLIATGHQLDDQAETLLYRLMRARGPWPFQGIRLFWGRVWRPLLGVEGAELRKWLMTQGVQWCEDSSNQSPDYLRNRIRMEVLPSLWTLHPDPARQLADRYEAHDRVMAAARMCVDQLLRRSTGQDDFEPFEYLERNELLGHASHEVSYLAIELWLTQRGQLPVGIRQEVIQTLLQEGAVRRWAWRGLNFAWRPLEGRLYAYPDLAQWLPGRVLLTLPEGHNELLFHWVGRRYHLARYDRADLPQQPPPSQWWLSADGLPELLLRAARPADRMQPFGMNGTKLLSDIFTDAKFTWPQRTASFVLTHPVSNTILYLSDFRNAEITRVFPHTRMVWVLQEQI